MTIYLKTDFHDSRAKRLNFGNGNLRIEQMLNISSCSASSVEIQQHDNVTTVLNSVINNDTQKRKRGRPKKNSDSKAPKYNRLIHQNLIL